LCRGGAAGPKGCTTLNPSPTSALAVGNVNGDRFADVVQGDAGAGHAAGRVRLWLGGAQGLPDAPVPITQNAGRVPGAAQPGHRFGSAVAAGDVTGDRYGDIVVGAPGDEDTGTVSIVPGSAGGPRPQDAIALNPPDIPSGGHFGAQLSLLNDDNDAHLDLYVGVDGVSNLDDALVIYDSKSDGGLDPMPQRGRDFAKNARLNARSPLYLGR
jgi:hypothetical protein